MSISPYASPKKCVRCAWSYLEDQAPCGDKLTFRKRQTYLQSAVLFYSSGPTSQSTLLTTTRPTFWQETANHFDKWQLMQTNSTIQCRRKLKVTLVPTQGTFA